MKDLPNGDVEIAAPLELVWVKEEAGVSFDQRPTLTLFGRDGETLLKAIAEGLSALGVKTESDSRLQGQLEAKQAHLEDMRKIAMMFMDDQHGKKDT